MSSNLARSPQPYVGSSGLVCKLSTINQKASDFAKQLEIEWPHNGLRHSYASHRLAHGKSAGEVALEVGNSLQMVFRHYRKLVTSADADAWREIAPATEEKTALLAVASNA